MKFKSSKTELKQKWKFRSKLQEMCMLFSLLTEIFYFHGRNGPAITEALGKTEFKY